MPPRTTFALADRQKDSCLHPSRPKRNIIQKEKAGNAPSLAHEKGHRQTHRQTTTTLIASGPPLRGDPYFVCISTTLLRNKTLSPYQPGSRTILYDSLVPTDANVRIARHSANVNGVPTRRRMGFVPNCLRLHWSPIGASDRLM